MHNTTNKPGNLNSSVGIALIAAAAGAVAGMLLAPKKGVDMRDDLKVRYNDMKFKTQDSAENTKDSMVDSVDNARSTVHDVVDKVSHAADKAADKTKDSVARAADYTKNTANDTVERAKASRTTTL